MFSRKKKAPPSKPANRKRAPVDFGIPGIPGFDPTLQDDDDDLEAELLALTGGRKQKTDDIELDTGDDDDLEAELNRILGGGSNKKKSRAVKTVPLVKSAMVDRSMSIDGGDDNDDDVDENDPHLLQELQMLTCEDGQETDSDMEEDDKEDEEVENVPSQFETIRMRLGVYRAAEAKAKAGGELAKARRFNRGVKTLEKLLKRSEAGEVVPFDEIPPDIARSVPSAPAPETVADQSPVNPTPVPKNESVQEEAAADQSPVNPAPVPKNESVQEEPVVPSLNEGPTTISDNDNGPVPAEELSQNTEEKALPPEPGPSAPSLRHSEDNPITQLLRDRSMQYKKAALGAKRDGNKAAALQYVRGVKAIDQLINLALSGQKISEGQIPPPPPSLGKEASVANKPAPPPVTQRGLYWMGAEVFSVPTTVMESFSQRLSYYAKAVKTAESRGLRTEASKCREIMKLYQNAILSHKKGGKIPYDKLPTPPGCPPIPIAFQI